jgi:hypothetical protein
MSAEHERTRLEVERYLLGELAPARVAALRERLGDAALEAARARHVQEHEALLSRLPPARFRMQVEARARRETRRRQVLTLAPVLAAALALLVWARVPEGALPVAEAPGERVKGLPAQLVVFRKRGAAADQLAPGAPVHARDVLQLGYVAGGRPFGLILSLDGAGAVTVHAPGPRLLPSGQHMLDRAYVLDEAPDFERFVLVTSEQPFDVATVMAAAERLAQSGAGERGVLQLPAGVTETSFVVRKEAVR